MAHETTVLKLFVAGDEPNSRRAKVVLKEFLARQKRNDLQVQVIDVLENYQAALEHQVLAIPTLLIETPAGRKTIIGSLQQIKNLEDLLV